MTYQAYDMLKLAWFEQTHNAGDTSRKSET